MNYLDLVEVPPRTTFNLGLTSPGNQYMVDLLGHPVKDASYRPDGKCTRPDAPSFTRLLVTKTIGPLKVTGLKPAVQSLQEVLGRVRGEIPDLYALLGTAGMQCARLTKIRQPDGTMRIGPGISNHSWGTAIDLTVQGTLDTPGNNLTQRGLLILSTYFNAAGWSWGASFRVEDAMHFEASKALLARWKAAGDLA
jgi:hypothetical protein